MNKKKKRNGFTIVELVIVIAVIGILSAVLIPTFSNLVKKAKESADQQLVYHINVAAAANEVDNGKAPTMYDTLQALENEYGFTIEKMTPRSGCDIVWDSVTNRFALVENGTTIKYGDPDKPSDMTNNKAQMWKITKAGESLTDGYSHYLTADWTGTVAVTTGVDVGDNDDITSVTYANDGEAQTVVIRTNSANTTLTIDDESTGTINHYGSTGELNIIQCHTASYHENGNVAFAEISKGRIVLENGSKIDHIHVNANENANGFDTVIIADNGAKALPEAITRDQVDVSEAKAVVTVESGSTSETVYVYPYTDAQETKTGTTEKTDTQNTSVVSALGQLVLDNGSDAGEKAMSNNQKEEAKTEAVDKAVYQEKIDTVSTKWTGETVELVTVTRNWIKNDGYVLPYGTEYVSGFGKNHPAESEDEFNTYYNNAVSFATMVETTLSGKFYLDTNEKTIHVCGADCLQYLYLLDDYLSAKNQIACKETKYPFSVFYNAEVGWEIKVDNDIDLGGKIENDNIINNWTPVNSQLAVNFQGHKVTNLVTDRYIVADGSITSTSGASGLFGFTRGQIKNLVLENVTIFNLSASDSSYAGAIAGNTCSGIFNCKVINANITSSKYVGAIAGMGYGAIENCTVENSSITGGYKLGVLIGQSSTSGNGFDYTNNTLKNVTIQLDRTLCPEETAYVVGKLVGYLQNNSTITGNTLTNVSIKVSSESGYVDLTDEIDIHKGSSGSNKSNDENGLVGIYETGFTVTF